MKNPIKQLSKTKLLDRHLPLWNTARAAPVLIPFAGIIMLLLNPSVMTIGFTIGAVASSPINALLKIIFKWMHYQTTGSYKGTSFLGQGMRPLGAKGTGVFLNCPLDKATSWGMPSGHSQIVWYLVGFAIGYLFIWRPYQFSNTHKIATTVIVILMALLVSFSRVWVDGVHTLLQVSVGGIIGFILGLSTLLITRFIAKKYYQEQFATDTKEIDLMTTNENVAEEAQIAAKEVESAKLAAEAAKQTAEKVKLASNKGTNSNTVNTGINPSV